MKLKIVWTLLTLFMLIYPKNNYAQELDTICFPIKTAEHLSRSSELFYLCDSLSKIDEEEIRLLREVLDEKQVQENLHQGVLSTLRNEVTKLRRQRVFLSVGLGGLAVLSLILAIP